MNRALRVYLSVVGLFAMWVGVWCYFLPELADSALPWLVPPLHSRFIGGMYLSGATLMFGSLLMPADSSFIAVVMAAVWTGMLGIVSFLHLDQFEFWRSTVWFWFFAYVAFPVAGALLAFVLRPRQGVRSLKAWVRVPALALGVICVALALVLFLAPDTMVAAWPWKITPLLAQLYSGPFLSYGVGALLVAGLGSARAARWPLISMAVFGLLVLVASLIHRGLFEPFDIAAAIWFGGLIAATAFVLAASTRRAF